MKWVWELQDWPNFQFDATLLKDLEKEFLLNAGKIKGMTEHLKLANQEYLQVEILCQEAINTSTIEGEFLRRDSVQSSIKKHLGLKTEFIKVAANEAGIAEMMVDLYNNFESPLNHQTLFDWHSMLFNGRRDFEVIGGYRIHKEPMQIVSGNMNAPRLFFEAPPSNSLPLQMQKFLSWYDESIRHGKVLETACLVHLYFAILHPFEDGNGRIGRALVEKTISQYLNYPSLNSLSAVIEKNRKEYYNKLKKCNHSLEVNDWLLYFSKVIIDSQLYTTNLIAFIIAKTKFFEKYNVMINSRQERVLLRVFEEGIDGFKGGLSAGNYKTISDTSTATATRDLQELVDFKALTKTGELKGTRYFLNLEDL